MKGVQDLVFDLDIGENLRNYLRTFCLSPETVASVSVYHFSGELLGTGLRDAVFGNLPQMFAEGVPPPWRPSLPLVEPTSLARHS